MPTQAAPAIPSTSAPTFNVGVIMDDEKTRNGAYRFTLTFKDNAGNICATIRGFRAVRPYMRLQLPISSWRDKVYSIVELSRPLEDALLALVKAKIEAVENPETVKKDFAE